jgi:hypothetical protein
LACRNTPHYTNRGRLPSDAFAQATLELILCNSAAPFGDQIGQNHTFQLSYSAELLVL